MKREETALQIALQILEVFGGSSFGRGASPASRAGCAIPLLLFCWNGRLKRGELLIFLILLL